MSQRMYFEMCNCPEIQDEYIPKEGDRYICSCDVCKKQERVYIICDYDIDCINKRDVTNTYGPYAEMVRSADICYFAAYWITGRKSFIYLPYAHQILDKIENCFSNITAMFSILGKWTTDYCKYLDIYSSIQEVMLAFYMYYKYDKFWKCDNYKSNKGEWVKKCFV